MQALAEVYPHLAHLDLPEFSSLDIEEIAKSSDIVFLALPHTKSAELAAKLLKFSCKVIDLSADLRLDDPSVYKKWYQYPSAPEELLTAATYGLAEIGNKEIIVQSQVVANPGCYPTATLLGLAPLIAANYLDLENNLIVIDAKSGVSGAGRSLNLTTHFCESVNNFSAYQVGGIHRHIPEIEQELTKLAQQQIQVQFTPHLLPIPRGMLVTTYTRLKNTYTLTDVYECYQSYYANQPFIRLYNGQKSPNIKNILGTNFCDIGIYLDTRTNYLTIISCIDNLIKGASGQALQNMNLMFALPETTGLQAIANYP